MKKWTRVLLLTAAMSMFGAISAFAAAEVEPNNDLGSANTAHYGGDYSLGYISSISDMDWWVLTANRTGSHSITFSRNNQPFNLNIYSPAGTLLYSGDGSSIITLNLVEGQTYRFLVYATSVPTNYYYPYSIVVN
ncbi:hypothetical protein [Paenibacillus sp. S150]|uniref:hypothetical protein n=1 Tax=Paenibacillus sp. S150 TaxID=2749826 RepID=UPI001C568A1A|nr:hypothetical protein [Paenibacillus sp. S150]MBW4082694.1 hypothetical protein [Paenibacillus sp. S150]